jgi:hypothetical protein
VAVARRGAVVILKYIYWWGLARRALKPRQSEVYCYGARTCDAEALASVLQAASSADAKKKGARRGNQGLSA